MYIFAMWKSMEETTIWRCIVLVKKDFPYSFSGRGTSNHNMPGQIKVVVGISGPKKKVIILVVTVIDVIGWWVNPSFLLGRQMRILYLVGFFFDPTAQNEITTSSHWVVEYVIYLGVFQEWRLPGCSALCLHPSIPKCSVEGQRSWHQLRQFGTLQKTDSIICKVLNMWLADAS